MKITDLDFIEIGKWDMPNWAEFISSEWGQNLSARYLTWKYKRKLKRYLIREYREKFIKQSLMKS